MDDGEGEGGDGDDRLVVDRAASPAWGAALSMCIVVSGSFAGPALAEDAAAAQVFANKCAGALPLLRLAAACAIRPPFPPPHSDDARPIDRRARRVP